MPQPHTVDLIWNSEADTENWARLLAACPHARHATVTLHGDLGAGKTTFVRHLLRAMGVPGRIKSPTYAVVEPHQAQGPQGEVAVWHFDFYRFEDPREWEDAGFRDLFASPGLKLVEWPDKAGPHLPAADLAVHIHTQGNESRHVHVVAGTPHGHAWLAAVHTSPPPSADVHASHTPLADHAPHTA
ncbi:MAG: tRNA (adenosine(37)-N6)-threonylcarbamoyltransferase complex ATPase subunit type 1 TsaE [Burkholderiales bacterium]|nr:tRNA (adenosine(37)-N6)-threonylcarbamoyltransferase complex ATPase subunit type 1 TsaE [Burkholderiales bacterium]